MHPNSGTPGGFDLYALTSTPLASQLVPTNSKPAALASDADAASYARNNTVSRLLVALYSAARACHEAKLFIVCCPSLKSGLMRPINHKLPVYTSAVPPTFRRLPPPTNSAPSATQEKPDRQTGLAFLLPAFRHQATILLMLLMARHQPYAAGC